MADFIKDIKSPKSIFDLGKKKKKTEKVENAKKILSNLKNRTPMYFYLSLMINNNNG